MTRLSNWLQVAAQMHSDLMSQLQPQRTRMLTDPYYRFQSIEEVKIAAALGIRIDVNRARIDDWLRLPGLSIHQARSLTQLTQGGVEFHSLEDVSAALNMPIHTLQPIEPILRFCYYGDMGNGGRSEALPSISLNAASAQLLQQIPLINADLAQAIVSDRQRHGAYRSLADFQQRLAIPAELMGDLIHYIRC